MTKAVPTLSTPSNKVCRQPGYNLLFSKPPLLVLQHILGEMPCCRIWLGSHSHLPTTTTIYKVRKTIVSRCKYKHSNIQIFRFRLNDGEIFHHTRTISFCVNTMHQANSPNTARYKVYFMTTNSGNASFLITRLAPTIFNNFTKIQYSLQSTLDRYLNYFAFFIPDAIDLLNHVDNHDTSAPIF